MSDLVERLREHSPKVDWTGKDGLFSEAAAEIEGLLAKVKDLAVEVDTQRAALWKLRDEKKQQTAESERLRARITELEEGPERCHRFLVTNGEKEGWCYSWCDHFDIHWIDGAVQFGVMDLSYIGVSKTFWETSP